MIDPGLPPNPNLLARDDNQLKKVGFMVPQYVLQTVCPDFDRSEVAEAKQDHPTMWQSLANNQITEVAVGSNEDALLATCNPKDSLIRQAGRVFTGYAGGVMSK